MPHSFRTLLGYLSREYGAPDLRNTVPRVTPPAPRNVTATDEERAKLLAEAPIFLRCFILVCSDLALRSGTAHRIAPQHYDKDRRELSFTTKFGDRQTLPVTDELAELFAVCHGPANVPYVWQLHPFGHISLSQLQVSFKRLRFKLGIKKRLIPHDLRRTTAVRVYEQTRDLRTVQSLLGHRSLPQTLHYLDHRTRQITREVLENAKPNGGVQ